MAVYASRTRDPSATKVLRFVQSLLCDLHPRDFDVELWDGTHWLPERMQFRRFTWRINNPDVVWDILQSSNRQVALGEAYIRGDFDLLGNLEAAFPLADYLIRKEWTKTEKLRLVVTGAVSRLKSRSAAPIRPHISGKPHSRERDQAAVSYHYDVSNDFYQLWLDRNMVYSCAYFEKPTDDLDTAQVQKMNEICAKLELRPGEKLIDIGCGWGGLIVHAVREYGVHAVGITLGEAQADFVRRRIQTEGLADRCEVRRLDYRDIDQLGSCDKLASVGMVEHVGESRLGEYFQRAFDVLRPGGMFLVSGIGIPGNRIPPDQPTFTDVYVFPDGELETIGTMLSRAESPGFEVRSVENLREHYGRTTSQWLHRLEAKAAEAIAIVGDSRYRTWRLYLAGSTYYFRKAWLGLYQTLLRKNQNHK
jgi:cyclopropane-fatty-acyl-phospholipid synthase